MRVARNDPTDTGGLFIGRRPGTGPVHYRGTPERGSSGRQRLDGLLALLVLAVETLLCLSVWGPQPLAWLWIASQVDYLVDSNFLGIMVAFFGILASLMITLALANRLDRLWRLLRRAAGHDQRKGVIGPIFGVCAVVGGGAFFAWLILIQGPGSSMMPGGA